MSIADVAHLLICPVCREPLALEDRTVRCPSRHSFDVARQGYVNLLGGKQPQHADTPAMVAARGRFLEGGHYAPIADALRDAVAGAGVVVDAGAGTGYYLAQALPEGALGVAADISTAAAKVAARQPGRIGVIVADTWAGLPLADGCADAVLAVFAPKNAPDFARIVRPGGVLLTITPTPRHLAEARTRFGLLGIDADKDDKLDRATADFFEPPQRSVIETSLQLDGAALGDVVGMGPNAFHAHDDASDAMRVTLSVELARYRRR